jgi:hypothetical protein
MLCGVLKNDGTYWIVRRLLAVAVHNKISLELNFICLVEYGFQAG